MHILSRHNTHRTPVKVQDGETDPVKVVVASTFILKPLRTTYSLVFWCSASHRRFHTSLNYAYFFFSFSNRLDGFRGTTRLYPHKNLPMKKCSNFWGETCLSVPVSRPWSLLYWQNIPPHSFNAVWFNKTYWQYKWSRIQLQICTFQSYLVQINYYTNYSLDFPQYELSDTLPSSVLPKSAELRFLLPPRHRFTTT
jgi:hypothetical protein